MSNLRDALNKRRETAVTVVTRKSNERIINETLADYSEMFKELYDQMNELTERVEELSVTDGKSQPSKPVDTKPDATDAKQSSSAGKGDVTVKPDAGSKPTDTTNKSDGKVADAKTK